MNKILLAALVLSLVACACACGSARADEPKTAEPAPAAAPAAGTVAVKAEAPSAKSAPAAGDVTIEGELVDLACYLEHGGKGEKHKACATGCAQSGLPIGLLDKHNKITIVVGDHKPMNTELADKMGTTVKLTGKVASRSGLKLIEVSSVQ